jgi:hypothetical protein
LDKPAKDGFSETYSCAQGYPGQYKISVRKVWGEVAGGKVTVHLVTDYGTPNQKVVSQQIPIDKEAVYLADVKTGHRAEPIAQVQLAKVQAEKAFAGQAVLAQIAPNAAEPNNALANRANANAADANVDPNWAYLAMLQRYAFGRSGSPGDGFGGGFGGPGGPGNNSGGFNGRFPGFVRGGGVGYMPIVQAIPSGTNLMANAVVSGDRRYVRVFSMPMFMGVDSSIPTFDTGVGGGGGGGFGGGGGGLGGGGGFGGGGFGGGGAF